MLKIVQMQLNHLVPFTDGRLEKENDQTLVYQNGTEISCPH